MTHLDLFSGYGGFHLGLKQAGFKFEHHYFSEIDKYAIANYKNNFPHAQPLGTVTAFQRWDIERPTIITFGSPCQDFSVAGKRAGIAGQRSGLIECAIGCIERFRPNVFIWENVKGTFSSNDGKDFWAIIKAFNDIGGYRLEWQLINTAWFLPQNRERIYLIGHLRGASGGQVFPFRENSTGINERATDTTIIRTLTAGGHSGGMHSSMTLLKYGTSQDQMISPLNGNAQCLNSGHYNVLKVMQLNTAKEFGNTPRTQNRYCDTNGLVPTLLAQDDKEKVPKILINEATQQGYAEATIGDSISIGVPNSTTRRGRVGKGITNTLTGVSEQATIVPKILTKQRNALGKATRKDYEAGNTDLRRKDIKDFAPKNADIANTLTSVTNDNLLMENIRIRRLTEIECERLQGLPNNWTKYGVFIDKLGNPITKEISATQRYKMIGNGVTVNVVQAIGERLIESLNQSII
jgi:DNA (cytosine-5)-methyltransferase 1